MCELTLCARTTDLRQVGSFLCRPIIEGIREQNKRNPMWRISDLHSVQLQRLAKKYTACVDLPFIMRELRMVGATK